MQDGRHRRLKNTKIGIPSQQLVLFAPNMAASGGVQPLKGNSTETFVGLKIQDGRRPPFWNLRKFE